MEDEIEFLVLSLMINQKHTPNWDRDHYEFIRLDTLRSWSWQSVPGEKFLGSLPFQDFIDITIIRMKPSFIERIEKGELIFDMGLGACSIADPESGRTLWRKYMGVENGEWMSAESDQEE